jgi:tRNA-binding EMAP/Myf-like protein
VGEILSVERHPDADKLFIEKIRLGDGERQIVSGLAGHYLPENLVGKKVVIVKNLAAAKLRGVESQGMLLVAEGREQEPMHDGKASMEEDAIEVIFLEKSKVGDKVLRKGEASKPKPAITIKEFGKVKMRIEDFVVVSEGKQLETESGEELRMKNVKKGVVGTLVMLTLNSFEIPLFVMMVVLSAGDLAIDRWRRTRHFLIAMLVGGICENTAVFLGGWSYSNANFLFAPLWLPVGWGMDIILLEEAFAQDNPAVFSKLALPLAFGGAVATGITAPFELGTLILFLIVSAALFSFGFFKGSELKMGIMAAVFGTAMESACIMVGNWEYSAAFLGTPLWLPLCWFNAFLIMRRVIRIGER